MEGVPILNQSSNHGSNQQYEMLINLFDIYDPFSDKYTIFWIISDVGARTFSMRVENPRELVKGCPGPWFLFLPDAYQCNFQAIFLSGGRFAGRTQRWLHSVLVNYGSSRCNHLPN